MYKANEKIKDLLEDCLNIAVLMDTTTIDELLCLIRAFQELGIVDRSYGISVDDFYTLQRSTTAEGE